MLLRLTAMSKNATVFSAFLLLLLLALSPPRAAAHGGVVNVTRVLLDAGHFGTFASLLAASGPERELEARQLHRGHGGVPGGITVFAPFNISFAQADPRTVRRLLAASPEDCLAVLSAHVASERLSLPELRAAARPAQPTLATEHDTGGAGRFGLNVTGSGERGSVLVSSGVMPTHVDDTLLEDDGGRKPAVAVFSVVDVLFPKEFSP